MLSMVQRGHPWAVLLAVIVAAPATADVVHLANGRSFEGVVAELGEERLRIRFDFGEIAIPRHLVTRVEKTSSALAEFEGRWAALAGRAGAGGADWLELARWARAAGLDRAAAQAALRAVELEPDVPGAAPLLTALGLVLDEGSGQWLRHEEAMARRGLVPFRGTWVEREEVSAVLAAEARTVAAEATAEREARLARAVELLALAQLAEATAARDPVAGLPLYGWPVFVSPVFVPVKVPRRPPPLAPGQDDVLHDLLHRNPGSLLPVGDPGRVVRSRFSFPAQHGTRTAHPMISSQGPDR